MSVVDWWQDSVFAALRWRDLLDILLMWFIAYRTVTVLRGTRALQSLVGLVALVLVYVVSRRLDLYAVGWLLDKFFVYLVLAVLILFQNDIRRALARAGGRFFLGFGGGANASAQEEVIQAAFALASRRIGALIVFERGAALQELVEAGHPTDSVVSQDLLMSVFHPTSPLHDGAAIIQKGRLAAAKVFLPLSLTQDIARYFGTRHRAALGLSEETDAVIVVVSEERGTVSVVMHGALTPVADTNELRQRLQEVLSPGPQRRGLTRMVR